jgi:dTMP kinase
MNYKINMRQGTLIVFEGVEGCGKTTQLERSRQWMSESGWLDKLQKDAIVTREPGGTAVGKDIRQLLLTPSQEPIQDRTELLLYAADRAQHVDGFLRPYLAAGAIILCDRYTDSTVAYQGFGRGLDRVLIDQLNQVATGGLKSDLTIWLDLPVEEGLARMQRRGKRDRIEQADLAFHQRVQQGFAHLAATDPDRFVRIDALGSEAEVAARIAAVLDAALEQWFAPQFKPRCQPESALPR